MPWLAEMELIIYHGRQSWYVKLIVLLLSSVTTSLGQPGRCDQTPPGTKVPSINSSRSPYRLRIESQLGGEGKYLPGQTYVLKLESTRNERPFHEFMITVEDPEVDANPFHFEHRNGNVGTLKTLDEDTKSRYSERCFSSVENTDNSDKTSIEMHWISPKDSVGNQKIRFRAMVAENKEAWYEGETLTKIMELDDAPPIDAHPIQAKAICNLCSEARYELIFKGEWSRGTHPYNYPSKPDDNGYSHMMGATHVFGFAIWEQGGNAKPGLKELAENSDISIMENEIISEMSPINGTRTLIKGKERHHPHMSEPSQALFRVDRIHHLFSVAIALRPSPDWFLGVSKFDLCDENEWLVYHELPLYPWDAGTMDGISYDSPRSMTQPADPVERVAVGSFDKASPFYQKNLNDLTPFGYLYIRRLDVYPLSDTDCNVDTEEDTGRQDDQTDEEGDETELSKDDPRAAESRLKIGDYSEVIPNNYQDESQLWLMPRKLRQLDVIE